MKKCIEMLISIVENVFNDIFELWYEYEVFCDPPMIHPIFYELYERDDWSEIQADLDKGVDRKVTLKNGKEIILTTNFRKK